MFDWLFGDSDGASELDSVRDSYWQADADAAKDCYDSIRGANWADSDEWERNLQRSEGCDSDDSDD